MKKKIFAYLLLPVILFGVFSVLQVQATSHGEGDITAGGNDDTTAGGNDTAPTNDTASGDFNLNITIDNPLATDIDTLPEFVEEVLRIVLKVGIPIVTLFIIYAGLLFVMAAGNPEKLKKAKETLLWTLVGAAVLLGAWVIAEAIQGTLTQLGA